MPLDQSVLSFRQRYVPVNFNFKLPLPFIQCKRELSVLCWGFVVWYPNVVSLSYLTPPFTTLASSNGCYFPSARSNNRCCQGWARTSTILFERFYPPSEVIECLRTLGSLDSGMYHNRQFVSNHHTTRL